MDYFLTPASKKSRIMSVSNDESKTNSWNCLSCSFLNHKDLLICEICERPKIIDEGKVTGSVCESSDVGKVSMPVCESSDSIYVDGIIDLLHYYAPFERLSLCSPQPYHFTQRKLFGKSWSCGYRNIQMICSSLMQRAEFRSVLFNGDGKIPGIRAMQDWIEKAWRDGFDPEGASQFKNKLIDKSVWIGATECTALLRYFGLRAIVVDFVPGLGSIDVNEQISMFLARYFQLAAVPNYSPLPLYFQHMGHSRTIVGIQQTESRSLGLHLIKNLLLFDPGCCGEILKSNLINRNNNWRKQVLRGINTLREPSYQIVYIADGIMTNEERNKSKLLIGERFDSPLKTVVI